MFHYVNMFQLAVPPADWPGHKTLSLTVTPFTKSCRKENRNLRCLISLHKDQVADIAFCLRLNLLIKVIDGFQALLSVKSPMHSKGVVLRRPDQLRTAQL